MKKKGFTLIELLAVIVILAVIALIAVPQILKVLNEARRGAAEDSVHGIAESAESYVADLLLANSGNYPNQVLEFECDGEKCGLASSIKTTLTTAGVTYKDNLQIKGKIPTSGTVRISANGQNITGINLEMNGFKCYSSKEGTDCYNDILPSEYQAVEYLESDGTQYIDTEILGKKSIGYDIEVKIKEYGTENGVFATSSATSGPHYVLQAHTSALRLYLSNANGQVPNPGIYQNDTTNFHIVKYNTENDYKIYLDGTYKATSGVQDTPDIPYSYALFARNYAGNVQKYSKSIIKYAKIYDGGALVSYLIPCYRKTDNEAGMYDVIRKKFYTNQGTGSFIIPE